MSHTLTYDEKNKKLTIRGAREFPSEVFDYADQLEILDMSDNKLTSLPDNLASLLHMRIAFFSGNTFSEVPPVLVACERLEMVGLKSCGIKTVGDHVLPAGIRGLILTDNNLQTLPDSIGGYGNLQKIMLTGNQLSSLPESFARLKKLELLRLAGNRLSASPRWINTLPNLAWYADSENNFQLSQTIHSNTYAWSDLAFGVKLGESAKNQVYMATINRTNQKVAVKLFGHGVTTDGSSDNDTTASLIAGAHPHIIGGLGRLTGAPAGQQGLVMSCIPSSYKSLGLPPDLTTLTRDLYAKGARFSLPTVLTIARDIGSALQHLHAKGIMHGDVYAHNILSTQRGKSVLADLGASSLYDRTLSQEAWREKTDVAGYGHVIEELLARTNGDGDTGILHSLATMCLNADSHRRPSFTEINAMLHNTVF